MGFVPVTLLSALGKRKRGGGKKVFSWFFSGNDEFFSSSSSSSSCKRRIYKRSPFFFFFSRFKKGGQKIGLTSPYSPYAEMRSAAMQSSFLTRHEASFVRVHFFFKKKEKEGGYCVCGLEIRSAQGTM